jgi:hypothetical protein
LFAYFKIAAFLMLELSLAAVLAVVIFSMIQARLQMRGSIAG